MSDFFGGLAASRKGWSGRREWASLEGSLERQAESDRTGHIYLRVHIRNGAPRRWEAQVTLIIEAGQLERLAAEARIFE